MNELENNGVIDWDGGGVEEPEDEEVIDLDGGSMPPAPKPTIMTDEQVEQSAEKLNELSDKDLKLAREEAAKGPKEGYTTEADIQVNEETGEKLMIGEGAESPFLEATFDEFVANHANDEIDMSINGEALTTIITDQFPDVNATEVMDFVEALKKYQDKQISATDAFNAMPKAMQDFYNDSFKLNNIPFSRYNEVRKGFIKDLIENIIHDAALNKYIVDMENQLSQVYKEIGKEANQIYQDSINDKIETLEEYKKAVEEDTEHEDTKPARLQALDDIIGAMHESYNLDKFKEAVCKLKVKGFDLEKPEKLVRDFDAKYINSKYNIQSLRTIFPVLVKKVGLSHEDAILFGVLLCKYCQNFRPTNLGQHTFMYYLIINILTLAMQGEESEMNEMSKKLIDSIKEVVKIRRDRDAAKEAAK